MLGAERRVRILELLEREGAAKVGYLARALGVNESTIRRDLERLQAEGLLERVSGGAMPLHLGTAFERPYAAEEHRQVELKRRIAAAAAGLVEHGDTLILEASSTVAELARQIRGRRRLTVVTNSPHIALELAHAPAVHIIVCGGDLKRDTMALVGPRAHRTLAEFHVDKAFVGITALSVERGLAAGSVEEAEVKRAILASARQAIGLADHTKLGVTAFAAVGPATLIHQLLTDREANEALVAGLRLAGVEVTLC